MTNVGNMAYQGASGDYGIYAGILWVDGVYSIQFSVTFRQNGDNNMSKDSDDGVQVNGYPVFLS